jgi:hypothetical protein
MEGVGNWSGRGNIPHLLFLLQYQKIQTPCIQSPSLARTGRAGLTGLRQAEGIMVVSNIV